MNNQLDQEVHNILTSIYQPEETDNLHDESQPRRTLNIYIEVEEQEEVAVDSFPTIDSTVDEQHPATPTTDDANTLQATEQHPLSNDGTQGYSTKHQQRPHPTLLLFLIIPLVGILAGIDYAVLLPLWTSSAQVTIVTASEQVTTTNMIELVTNGAADLTKNQVPGRALAAITMSQQKTVPTTGTGHQDAKAAHGILTLYNAAPYAQTVEAGTLLTGADGVQIITDQDALIPSAIMPTEGQASVSAHAVIAGPQGNIRTGDIYGACCRLNVFVAGGAFQGGQDARTYQSVTPQDITNGVTTVKTGVEQSVQAALQTQVQPSETLVTPLSCTAKVTPDHRGGEEATQVQVILDETCTGVVYSTQALTMLATQRATADANTRLGTGYTTTGVQTRLIQVHPTQHRTFDLQLQSVSVWTYPFTQEQQNSIKTMIAGMSKDKATATLLHMQGVQSVSITFKNSTTLPTDAQHISILFLQV